VFGLTDLSLTVNVLCSTDSSLTTVFDWLSVIFDTNECLESRKVPDWGMSVINGDVVDVQHESMLTMAARPKNIILALSQF
jgi:hypothetical protein